MICLYLDRIYQRTITAGGIFALASLVMGAAPLWHMASASGLTNNAPQSSVNRLRKGDRLPITTTPAARHDLRVPQSLQNGKNLRLGCDPVFGPIASPAAKSVYGRCMV